MMETDGVEKRLQRLTAVLFGLCSDVFLLFTNILCEFVCLW